MLDALHLMVFTHIAILEPFSQWEVSMKLIQKTNVDFVIVYRLFHWNTWPVFQVKRFKKDRVHIDLHCFGTGLSQSGLTDYGFTLS